MKSRNSHKDIDEAKRADELDRRQTTYVESMAH